MISRSRLILSSFVCLSLMSTACSKDKKKFGLSGPHKEGELIVTLKDEALQKGTSLNLLRSYGAKAEGLNQRSYLLRFSQNENIEKIAEEISRSGEVLAVEANQIYQLYETNPDDAEFSKLWGLKNSGQNSGTVGIDIGATTAWDHTTGSKDVLVAVVDSGTDYKHPDLVDNIWSNPGETGLDANGKDKKSNGIDDDQNGLVDDWHGYDFFNNDNDPMDDHSHGTHVAGTIGAKGGNGIGVAGVNWNVSLVPIKVFSASGATSTDVLVKGIEYATSLGVFVSNNSWGGGEYSEAIYGAIKKANEKGILFVAAAGNESANNDVGLHYPSNYDSPNIISVAAINRNERIASFSNFGAKTVDVAAPGEDIYSTIPNGKYALKSGTSMASPHVTGALALLKAKFPESNSLEIKEKLIASSIPSVILSGKLINGRINVANAMEEDSTSPGSVKGFDLTSIGVNFLEVAFSPAGDDGDEGRASSYQIRLSQDPILNDEQWQSAEIPQVSNLRLDADLMRASVINLSFNRKGYITVRAYDNVGNAGALSESLNFSLKPVATLWLENNDEVNLWSGFGTPWAVRSLDGITMVSDSPEGPYANGTDKSVVSRDLSLGTNDLTLELRHRFELEKDFDYGLVEISSDSGVTWKEVGRFTGKSDWTDNAVSLKTAIGQAQSFRFRLRIRTDNSVQMEGWDIDTIKIIGEKVEL